MGAVQCTLREIQWNLDLWTLLGPIKCVLNIEVSGFQYVSIVHMRMHGNYVKRLRDICIIPFAFAIRVNQRRRGEAVETAESGRCV